MILVGLRNLRPEHEMRVLDADSRRPASKVSAFGMVVGRFIAFCTSSMASTDLRVGVPPRPFSTLNWFSRDTDQMAKI